MDDPISEAIEAERKRGLAALHPFTSRPRSPMAVIEQLQDRMGEALAYRLGGPAPTEDEAIPYVAMSFQSMIEGLLLLRGERRWSTRLEMFSRAITTSDVPALLTGAGNRLLREAYTAYGGGLLRVAERVPARDFRDVKAIQLDGDGLSEVSQAGEFKQSGLKAGAESFPISVFGRIYALTRTLFSDDDLGVFAQLSTRLGRMAAEYAAGKLAALVDANGNLADGQALFSAPHANLGTAAALSETTVGALLALVRNQVGLGGVRISAIPRALVVPSALELTARKVVAAMGVPAPLEVIVEPRLSSPTAHYIVADPATVEGLAYSYGASDGPSLEIGQRRGFEGLAAKVVFNFGAGFVDHRGWAKNAGA